MPLSDANAPFEDIAYGGTVIRLHPLPLFSLCGLFAQHAQTILPAAERWRAACESGNAANIEVAALHGISDCRDLIAEAILHSAKGTPADPPVVKAMPALIQMESAQAVVRLTGGDAIWEASPGGLVASFISPGGKTDQSVH